MHPIENILNITMSELQNMADVNTIVGKPFVTPEGQTIVPISKLSFGFASGGSEFSDKYRQQDKQTTEYPFAGGSSVGVSIAPVAFMVSGNDDLRLLTVNNRTVTDKLLEQLPELMKLLRKTLCKKEEETKGERKEKMAAQSDGMQC